MNQRHLKILKYALGGWTHKQIGQKMEISERRVKNILSGKIFKELGVDNCTAAIWEVIKIGLIPVEIPPDAVSKLLLLSTDERSLLVEVAQGYTNRKIAIKRNLPEGAVRYRTRMILKRLGCRCREQSIPYVLAPSPVSVSEILTFLEGQEKGFIRIVGPFAYDAGDIEREIAMGSKAGLQIIGEIASMIQRLKDQSVAMTTEDES